MIRLLFIFLLFANWTYAYEPPKEIIKQSKKIVKLASKELSKTLPQTIDKYTKLTKIEGKDTTLTYTFEINTGSKSDKTVRKEDHSRMKKAVTYGVCKSNQKFLEAYIDITYLYISTTSKEKLFQFDITNETCLNNKS